MVTFKKAISLFKDKHPELTVVSALDLNRQYYVLTAVKSTDRVDFNAPYYSINKQTGAIGAYNPVDDLDEFSDALEHRRIKGAM